MAHTEVLDIFACIWSKSDATQTDQTEWPPKMRTLDWFFELHDSATRTRTQGWTCCSWCKGSSSNWMSLVSWAKKSWHVSKYVRITFDRLVDTPEFHFFGWDWCFKLSMCHSKWVLLTKCQRVCVGRHVQVKENDGSIRCHMVTHQVLGSHLQQPAVGQDSKIPPRIAHKNATQLQHNLHHITCQLPTYHWLRIDWECLKCYIYLQL